MTGGIREDTTNLIKCVADALKVANGQPDDANGYVFRGHGDYNWYFNPSLFRNENLYENEDKLVLHMLSEHPNLFVNDNLMIDKLVRMQHFELPTRLMDVSRNLLVALYFATQDVFVENEIPKTCIGGKKVYTKEEMDGALFIISPNFMSFKLHSKHFDSDKVSVLSNLSQLRNGSKLLIENLTNLKKDNFNKNHSVNRLCQFIRGEKSYFKNVIIPKDLFDTILLTPKKSNERIKAQQGEFLLCGFPNKVNIGGKEILMPNLDAFNVIKYRISKEWKSHIRQELKILGITESSIYPSLVSTAKDIVDKYRYPEVEIDD